MWLGYTPDGIVLVSGYYVTCLDLLFSKKIGAYNLYFGHINFVELWLRCLKYA